MSFFNFSRYFVCFFLFAAFLTERVRIQVGPPILSGTCGHRVCILYSAVSALHRHRRIRTQLANIENRHLKGAQL